MKTNTTPGTQGQTTALGCDALVRPPFFFPLFEHMAREHGLTLIDSELSEIVRIAEKLGEERIRLRALLCDVVPALDSKILAAWGSDLEERICRELGPNAAIERSLLSLEDVKISPSNSKEIGAVQLQHRDGEEGHFSARAIARVIARGGDLNAFFNRHF